VIELSVTGQLYTVFKRLRRVSEDKREREDQKKYWKAKLMMASLSQAPLSIRAISSLVSSQFLGPCLQAMSCARTGNEHVADYHTVTGTLSAEVVQPFPEKLNNQLSKFYHNSNLPIQRKLLRSMIERIDSLL
jgi:hypothetical protein